MIITFGAMAQSLAMQLERYEIEPSILDAFEKDLNAISRLYIRSLISESQTDQARIKVVKRIEKHAKPKKEPS